MEARSLESYSYERPIGSPVVSIDLGTSRSAMAVTFVGSETSSQELILPQGSSTSYGQLKVQTALLLQKKDPTNNLDIITSPADVEVLAFGDEAESHYTYMEQTEKANVCFASHYKMELYRANAGIDPILTTHSSGGFQISLKVALTKTLEIMLSRALSHLRRTFDDNIIPSSILWVLTIPAIWDEAMTQFMRERAFEAKIIGELDSENLVLCLEPEGVCFAALFAEVESTRRNYETISRLLLTKKSKFIVLDAGGGTVDLASYEVVSDNPFKVKQVATPTGGPYGSTQADERFMAMLGDVIGEEANTLLHAKYPHVALEIRRSWETIKINAKRDGPTSQIQLASLQSDVLTPLGLSLPVLISNYKASHELTPESKGATRMAIPMELVATFFEPSIGLIIECLEKYRSTTPAGEASYLLLAGGYSGSSFLCDALSRFIANGTSSESLRMFFVAKPDIAIVRGAAIYGTAHKDKVTHRIAKHTYGISLMILYNGLDVEHQKRVDKIIPDQDGAQYIKGFVTLVTIGTEIPVGFTSLRMCSIPLLDAQEFCISSFLASSCPSVRFPDEEGVFELANFCYPNDMTVPLMSRESYSEFEFGGTEIKCRNYKNETSKEISGHANVKYH